MNTLAIILGVIALFLVWWNLWISIKIVKYLKSKGNSASLFSHGIYVKGKIFRYLPLYRKLTIENTGKIGKLHSLFYFSFFSMLIVLAFGIILVV
jgi:hypothetical protein